MYDIGFITKTGDIIHATADVDFDCSLLDAISCIEKDLNCEVFSIQRVFIEKEKLKNEKKAFC